MENNELEQQLEEWKQKYYQSINDLEKQQTYDEVLQRSIGRLALAAQGMDASLDKQLSSLRKALRSKKDQHEIQDILELMEKAISRMEQGKSKDENATTGEVLADLLNSLKLPKPFKNQAKTLSQQLKSASREEVAPLIPELLSLLENSLSQTATKSSRGFGFSLFGRGKSSDKDEEKSQKQDDTDTSANEIPAHHVLMQLLERLSLPDDLSKKATKIRLLIETGIDAQQLPQIINDIAEIVSTLGSQVVAEKQDYEEFLKSLSSKLQELDQHIRETSEYDIKAFEERTAIGNEVENEVRDIRNQVEKAEDLDQLKSTVSEHMDSLNQHFERYQKSDHDRFEQSQKQIQALNIRIKSMEQESNKLREAAQLERDKALKDALTGIWNRQALNEALEKEFTRWKRYKHPLSIIVWDVDFFKRVNDSYGHAAGDKVLKTIAGIFQNATRDVDFIARFGGEEFVGILPETDLKDSLNLANKVREKIEKFKFRYEDTPVEITASAGLATFEENDTIDDVFKRADKALYKAKERGRNRCLTDKD
ncbi:MAG: GGDEF domain-containing protein [Gammaproteobacteria bacterium]|nr:GGDEF domain-containing protein [Gammaproteobacteria bacterium]